jgi:hypothetical protein
MTRLTSKLVKVAFVGVVVLPALVSGCVNNVWASGASTAVDTGIATFIAVIVDAIANRLIPVPVTQ